MILGNPNRFAFMIERINEWEDDYWKNGIFFVILNDEIYPKDVRTTTFNCELPELLKEDSALVEPIIDVVLYDKSDAEIVHFVDDEENENYYRYFIPFHEIEDSGYRFYVVSNGENVKLLVYRLYDDWTELVNKLELSTNEYRDIVMQLKEFYKSDFT